MRPGSKRRSDLVGRRWRSLLGTHTPFSAANYAIGITAVLPTNGAARAISGITARDMLRTTTLGELDAAALAALAPTIGTLARYEGLPCHAAAAEARSARRLSDSRPTVASTHSSKTQ